MADTVQAPPQGPQAEVNTRKPINNPGVYEHSQAKKQIIVMPDAQSTAGADAAARMGYVKVAEPPSRVELQAMQDAQRAKDLKAEAAGQATGVNTDEAPAAPINGTATPAAVDPSTHSSVVQELEETKRKLEAALSKKPAASSSSKPAAKPAAKTEASAPAEDASQPSADEAGSDSTSAPNEGGNQ